MKMATFSEDSPNTQVDPAKTKNNVKPVQETEFPSPDDMLQENSLDTQKEHLFHELPSVENLACGGVGSDGSSPEPVEHEENSFDACDTEFVVNSRTKSNETEDQIVKSTHDEHEPIQIQDRNSNGELCTSESCSSSATSRDLREALRRMHDSGSFNTCDECELLQSTAPSRTSVDFWNSVENKGKGAETSTKCHQKFFCLLLKKLKEAFPKEDGLKNKTTITLLRRLLGVSDAEDTAEVLFTNYVKVVRFFGPVREEPSKQGTCTLLSHLNLIVKKSLKQTSDRNERISWFAGDMSRDDSEVLLQEQQDTTYLVRMSQSNAEEGNFVVSVKYGGKVHHFEIENHPEEAAVSDPFHANLEFNGKVYDSLPALVDDLPTEPIHDHTDEDDNTLVWCRRICPNLPLNSVIRPYKSSKRKK